MRLLPLVAAAVLLAGCVSAPDDAPQPAAIPDPLQDVWAAVAALMGDVPCEATVPGEATSENLLPLGLLELEDTGLANLDVWSDLIVAGHGLGLDVISVHDPRAPRVVATFAHEQGFGDAKWIANGTAVAAAHGRTIEIVDVSAASHAAPGAEVDPDALTSLGIWEYPPPPPGHQFTNMHMLEAHQIAGEDYVFVAPNDDTGVWWFKVTIADGKASFETMPPLGAPLSGGPLGPHDMTVVQDAAVGGPVLYIANGFEGWQAWDLSDPGAPERLAIVPNLLLAQGYTHTVAAAHVDDRRIVVTIAEVGSNVMSVFDATDFRTPILLAQWWAELTAPHMPQHDINIVGPYLTLGHYTEGAYVFDLSGLDPTPLTGTIDLKPVAHYLPANPQDAGTLGFANVFDVVVVKGVLYVSDFTDPANALTGVGFGCLSAGEPGLSAG